MPQVQIIEPIRNQQTARLRVCAYARVSSDSEDQQHSFAAQVRYYTTLIASHEDWEFVDIYADEGITGTRADKREDFQRMMQDCRDGKIDRILVKSLSRFARNTQDCIAAVRELKQLGVTVVFEKEHLNTGTMANEMFLSMMSAFAQEESISISQNMRKGARMRMENGTYQLSVAPYGYRLDDNHNLVIEPAEAAIVREIFQRFLDGENTRQIADSLRERELPNRNRFPTHSKNGIVYILTNERYIGDECFQKYVTTSTLPFAKIPNRGQASKFYVENTHEGIISRETFAKAQTLLSAKREQFGRFKKKPSSVLSGRIRCGCCQSTAYRRVTRHGIQWVCSRHLQCARSCPSMPVEEIQIWNAFEKMILKLSQNNCDLLSQYLELIVRIQQNTVEDQKTKLLIANEMAELLNKVHVLERLKSTGCIETAFYVTQRNMIDRQLSKLKSQRKLGDRKTAGAQISMKTNRLISILNRKDETLSSLFQDIVTGVIINQSILQFELINGLHLAESMEVIK